LLSAEPVFWREVENRPDEFLYLFEEVIEQEASVFRDPNISSYLT
jgi:hypothetical protein